MEADALARLDCSISGSLDVTLGHAVMNVLWSMKMAVRIVCLVSINL